MPAAKKCCPKAIENLIDISYISFLGSKNNIKNISQLDKYIILVFNSIDNISPELIHYLSTEYGKRLEFDLSNDATFKLRIKKDLLDELKSLIEKISSLNNNENNI